MGIVLKKINTYYKFRYILRCLVCKKCGVWVAVYRRAHVCDTSKEILWKRQNKSVPY